MKLIIFSGLPGTGKTTVAEIIGRKLSIPVFAKDWVEATLLRCGLLPESKKSLSSGYIAYELLTILTQKQLQLGQSVILDCVTSTNTLRKRWCQLADDYHAVTYIIECICSDKCVRRARLGQRQRGIPGWHELDWSEVERVNNYYEPWHEKRLVLDSANPLEENLELAFAYISNTIYAKMHFYNTSLKLSLYIKYSHKAWIYNVGNIIWFSIIRSYSSSNRVLEL